MLEGWVWGFAHRTPVIGARISEDPPNQNTRACAQAFLRTIYSSRAKDLHSKYLDLRTCCSDFGSMFIGIGSGVL